MLYLYDDAVARRWQPFALTRPIGELLLGAYTFRDRAERFFGERCTGHVSAPHLLGFDESDAAPVVDLASIDTSRPRIFLSSRAVLDSSAVVPAVRTPAVLRVGDDTVGFVLPAGTANPGLSELDPGAAGDGMPEVRLAGRVLRHVWDLVAANAEQIARDFDDATGVHTAEPAGDLPFQTIAWQPGRLRLGRGVTIEPNVVLDFTRGPIWFADDVTVRAFSRVAGPAYVGRGSTLLGGPYDAVSIGPVCKVHGELEESVVLGYSNKAHDGFLGHAYLGRWVNLGALTTNSDLKNNYGTIRMWTPHGDVDTGLIKLGCLLGDHVKTGIGALINTGTVIGAGSNLYGTDMPPKYVPPFSWGTGAELTAFDIDRFIGVAQTAMGRRKLELSGRMREILREAWRIGRGAM